ncbi:hypothetical protein [Pseudenhygromyxa sp. WMMC2535]|nr:hypothetical protein [Pseudenhygromyxa sp. WMMC2535]
MLLLVALIGSLTLGGTYPHDASGRVHPGTFRFDPEPAGVRRPR